MKLTESQKKILERLKQSKLISLVHTTSNETRALNCLVKKGVVIRELDSQERVVWRFRE